MGSWGWSRGLGVRNSQCPSYGQALQSEPGLSPCGGTALVPEEYCNVESCVETTEPPSAASLGPWGLLISLGSSLASRKVRLGLW